MRIEKSVLDGVQNLQQVKGIESLLCERHTGVNWTSLPLTLATPFAGKGKIAVFPLDNFEHSLIDAGIIFFCLSEPGMYGAICFQFRPQEQTMLFLQIGKDFIQPLIAFDRAGILFLSLRFRGWDAGKAFQDQLMGRIDYVPRDAVMVDEQIQ